MKVYLNKTSPYARLVMVVAHEKGLSQKITPVWVDPWASPDELLSVSPFSKVPVLVTDQGTPLTESTAICDYLDHVGDGRRLVPNDVRAREPVLYKVGLGRGLIDCAFGVTIERRFGDPKKEPALAQRWLSSTSRSIQVIAGHVAKVPDSAAPDLGDIAIAVGLSYAQFRLPEVNWGPYTETLAEWFAAMMDRHAFRLTAPE